MDSATETPRASIDPTAVVEDGADVGDGTRIWHFAQVRSGARLGNRCVLGKSFFIDTGAVIGSG